MKKKLLLAFLISYGMFAQNLLIKNTSFEDDLYGWDYGVHGNTKLDRPIAKFTTLGSKAQHDSFACKVNIEKSFKESGIENVYLIQDRLKLKKGKEYKVTFYVKSNVENDEIYAAAGSGSIQSDRKMVTRNFSFKGDGTWKELSYVFKAKSLNSKKAVDFKNAAIYFGFNHREGQYFIDNVSVELVKKK